MRHRTQKTSNNKLRQQCRCWWLLLLSVFAPDAVAQYRADFWTTDNGLPQNSITGIQQTKDGYLWLATFDGLVRYDGVRFTVFDHTNTPGLLSNRLTALFEDRRGALWIGTEDSGLTRHRNGVFTSFRLSHGLPDNQIRRIQEDSAGQLIVTTQTGIVCWQNGRFVPVPESGRFTQVKVHYGQTGARWWFDGAGLHQVRHGRQTDYSAIRPSAQDGILRTTLYEDRAGTLWIWTFPAGLFRLKDGVMSHLGEKDGMPVVEEVPAIYEDRAGSLWFATHGAGLVRYQNKGFSSFGQKQGLLSNYVRSVAEDHEGTLWAGTSDRGLNRLTAQMLTAYSVQEGLGDKNIYPIYQDKVGAVWIGSACLTRFANGRFTNFTQKDFPRLNSVQALTEDNSGRLWIGLVSGLLSLQNGRFTDHSVLVSSANTFAIHQDRAGDLWFGTEQGLFRLRENAVTRYTIKDGLPSDDIKILFEDRQGRFWIGTYGGLARLENGKFISLTIKNGLKSNRVRSLYEDADGVLWIGTYDGGLSRLKDGRITSVTTENGLFNNGVFQILEDRRGNFWMSCNKGIYRVSRRLLNEFAEGRVSSVTSLVFGKQDGLLNTECNGGRWPAGIKALDGRLWFPTQEGVVVVDPEAAPLNAQPPPVRIESVILDRSSTAFENGVTIRPGQGNLEINYTGLSFIKSEQMQFKYKLLSQDWVEAGSRRTAYFPYLPPGEYTFTVIAANSDGVWNEQGAGLRLTVLPPFYRTWWFSILLALTLLGLAAAFYRRRIAQLKRTNALQTAFSRQLIDSQETERKRIAAELHDGLGQSLIVIKNQSVLSFRGIHNGDDREELSEQINGITSAAAQAIQEMKEISHNLRPYLLDRLGLGLALESMLKKVSASGPVRFTTELDRIDNLFPKESEIHLYRLVQESVNNILKHAEATEAHIVIRKEARQVILLIEDDGKGFELSVEARPKSSFGLIGIAERTRLLGGRHSIDSAPGKGTRVKIEIPYD